MCRSDVRVLGLTSGIRVATFVGPPPDGVGSAMWLGVVDELRGGGVGVGSVIHDCGDFKE
jgi:hypothetical protein